MVETKPDPASDPVKAKIGPKEPTIAPSQKSKSALHENIEEKGAHAYYYAHNRTFEVPENAIIRSGPGIITGGMPELIAAIPKADKEAAEKPTESVKGYSWTDEKAAVKIYIDFPCELTSETIVNMNVDKTSLQVIVESDTRKYVFVVEKLKSEVVPEECYHRVSTSKNRVTATLKKKSPFTWSELKRT
eukprot:GEMP01077417.1.p1 GENE.GEMP01077417.1~~GEMP01077417.1.p1  ORF type:complete len:189 (+),score=23.07 GEMP01077417.1:85-651(+)